MFTTHPPLPTPEAIRDLHRDQETMHLLTKLRADVATAVRKLEPESLLALARQHHPEAETDYQAAAMLGLEIMDALRALSQHGEDVRNLDKAETARLAPMVAEAGRRSIEIAHKLEGAARSLRFAEGTAAEREANLRKAGVIGDNLQRLMADGEDERAECRSTLNAERTAMLAEQEALSKFLKSGNERHLPEGFHIVEVPRISGRDAHHNHVGAARAA
ncbi:hypothetical protein [Herminiimonas sp. CN]|uniref:hypothetical protein n=1 Tax=Herminiimonas sp. CN TaxID=1349818 RepID=UPI0004731EA2|nr:hypothetical protein [Herminiimonas sp. CN]